MNDAVKKPLSTILPLPSEILQQVFKDKNIALEIDYDNSKNKTKPALIYLTNLNLATPVSFKISNKEDAFALIDAYITQKSTINIPGLVASVISILFWLRDIVPNEDDVAFLKHHSLIQEEDLEDYLLDPQRAMHIVRLIHVIDNIPTYIFTCSREFRDAQIPVEEAFHVVNSLDYTGFTFANILKAELFTANYYTQEHKTDVTYFKQQFEEYLFAGENLFGCLKDSHLFPSLRMIDGVTFKREDLTRLLETVKEAQL